VNGLRPYRITYSGDAFGDNLFSAFITAVLNDNGIPAVLSNPKIAALVECPIDSGRESPLSTFDCRRRHRPGLQTCEQFTVYSDLLRGFRQATGCAQTIAITRDCIPVKYRELPDVPSVHVAMVTRTGCWTPYRNWPHFHALQGMLDSAGITYVDLSAEGIRDIRMLNYVKKAQVFLGLETGASHYASRFANGKAVILQSGYCDFNYWAGAYHFDRLALSVECSPCWLRGGCPRSHSCMSGLAPETVLRELSRRLH